jgi:hypothetical protein
MGLAAWWCGDPAVLAAFDDSRFTPCFRFTVLLTAVPCHIALLLYIFFGATFWHPETRVHRLRSSLFVCNLSCAVVACIALATGFDPTASSIAMWPRFCCGLLAAISFVSVGIVLQNDFGSRTRHWLMGLLCCLFVCLVLEGISRAQQLFDGQERVWTTSVIYTHDILVLLQIVFLAFEEVLARRREQKKKQRQQQRARDGLGWRPFADRTNGKGTVNLAIQKDEDEDEDGEDESAEATPLLRGARSVNSVRVHVQRASDSDDSHDGESEAEESASPPPLLTPNSYASVSTESIRTGPARHGAEGPSPEQHATLASRFFFVWIWPLLARAYTVGSLVLTDLPPVRAMTGMWMSARVYVRVCSARCMHSKVEQRSRSRRRIHSKTHLRALSPLHSSHTDAPTRQAGATGQASEDSLPAGPLSSLRSPRACLARDLSQWSLSLSRGSLFYCPQ